MHGHILSSPMFKIKTKGFAEEIGLAVFKTMNIVGMGDDYIPAGGPSESEAWEENRVTTSKSRYLFCQLC